MKAVLPIRRHASGPLTSFLFSLAALTGCTERPITDVDPDMAPGGTVPTKEVVLATFQLPEWRDTSFVGFALPGQVGFSLLSGSVDFQSRLLGRFSTIPDSVFVFADSMTVAVDSFLDASVRITMDTTAANFPDTPFTLRLFLLTQGIDGLFTTWEEAAPGTPWMTPGGDLGTELGSVVVEEVTDTTSIVLPMPQDSILKAWREADGEPGVAILVEGTTSPLRVVQTQLRFDVQPEGDRNTLLRLLAPQPSTFIFDPPQPEVGSSLRVVGLPAWRFYVVFQLPDSLVGIPLKKATINQATLTFRPLTVPPEIFIPSRQLLLQAVEVLGDPFQQGPKTPIGPALRSFLVLDPDSLAAGRPLQVDITGLVAAEALSEDPLVPIRIAIGGLPDAQDFGFWEFASAEHPNDLLRPQLLIVLTPPPLFDVP